MLSGWPRGKKRENKYFAKNIHRKILERRKRERKKKQKRCSGKAIYFFLRENPIYSFYYFFFFFNHKKQNKMGWWRIWKDTLKVGDSLDCRTECLIRKEEASNKIVSCYFRQICHHQMQSPKSHIRHMQKKWKKNVLTKFGKSSDERMLLRGWEKKLFKMYLYLKGERERIKKKPRRMWLTSKTKTERKLCTQTWQ